MINKVNGNGVSRAVFECIKENVGSSFDWVVSYLVDCGYKKTSVSSLISQMVAQGMVAKVDGDLFARVAEYRPLRSTKKKKPARKAKAEPVPVLVAEKLLSVTPAKVQMTAVSLLETLSVLEAHELYLELRSMFGEK
jgi:hypothetical protein